MVVCCGILAQQESSGLLIDILEYNGLCDQQVKEFKVSKYVVNISVLFLIEKCMV